VADPNHPWKSCEGDCTYIEVYKDNTFRFAPKGRVKYQSTKILGGLLPGTLMFEMPYHRLSSHPRTPFWEVLQALAFLVGGVILLAGDAESSQITGDGRKFYKRIGRNKRVVSNGIPGMARIPFLDAASDVPELYARTNRLPRTLNIDLRGKKRGKYTQLIRTDTNAVSVENPVVAGAQDRILVTGANTGKPILALETSQAAKKAKIKYSVILDPRGRDNRTFEVDVGQAKQQTARVYAAPRGGSFVVAQAGRAQPFNLKLKTVVNRQVKMSTLRLAPAAGEVLRVRPQDWSSSLDNLVIETLSSLEGSVIGREIRKLR
jgi:hypothetical protein